VAWALLSRIELSHQLVLMISIGHWRVKLGAKAMMNAAKEKKDIAAETTGGGGVQILAPSTDRR
jgi:hypothetical protein